ncbi:xyloglucan 6-xylosyltransferase 2-like [Amaranthus tricolor]|uniref:xyloglucan 6-xylosyltransferase 2-like n=1 Tax=Amaranthus tricolor TaxID=29722 RepID=UPI002586B345|nr:xyloglucan 6-xylosyltransferase 2-like [Amaranthus tricolor]
MIERCLGVRRTRQIYRFFRHCNVTFLCLLLTIIVLRGTIGAGKFGTPEKDFIEIRKRLSSRKILEPHRVLEEVKSSSATSNSFDYANFDYQKFFSSDNDDDLESSSKLSSVYKLGLKVLDWDERREKWLSEHPEIPNFTGDNDKKKKKKPRVLLVTGSSPKPCENPVGDHYLLKSLKNKIDYSRLHGIEVFYNMALLDAEMSGFWAKLPLIKTLLLGRPDVEFLWWMDSDAMFTDMEFELPWERYEGYNVIIHGWKEMVFEQKNWIGLNTGSFLIRNCQWSLNLLDAWAAMGPKGKTRIEAGQILTKELKDRPPFEAHDQSAMVYLLAKEKEKWGAKIYLENSYYLHGYWGVLVDHYEDMIENHHPGLGDHRWPLVTHFVGCKPCGKISDYPVERCLKQMERTFNFGDNQVLKLFGFTHLSLASRRVKRIRNETQR